MHQMSTKPSIWNFNEVDSKRLAQEFFQGVDARYEHILAGLDVVRSEKLAEIHQKFESSNVVIMHGASGQGKSTLAFRYLHDYAPNDWRFYVDLRVTSDTRQMLRVANALSGHAQAIDRPCMVYIDVSPSDQDWPELVRALSYLTGLRVLVTIREEDWRRATSYRTRFSSEELELRFDMEEANNLYAQLREPSSQFLAFDEAWSGFGGKGPLMEFMYFLTQKETLKSRIESQIQNLQDRLREGKLKEDELHLLRLVAVASAYEAKLDLRAVVQHLSLSESSRTIELFTKEYLIRIDENDSTITGLHSVRSSIMLESLLDEVLRSWESVAVECLSLLMENDLEIFLMHAFSRRRDDSTALLRELESFRPESWTGVAGILRALLWLGVRNYTDTNRALIDQEYEKWGSGWFFKLDSDLAEIAGDTMSGFLDQIAKLPGVDGERLLKETMALRAQQTSKSKAFLLAKTWLERLEPIGVLSPRPQDWAGFSQVLFWAASFQERHVISLMCEQVDLDSFIEEFPISTLADLIYTLHIALGDGFHSIFQEYRTRVESRFKRETNTFSLEDDGAVVRANFIPDFAYATNQEESTDGNTTSLTLHEETMYRVDLLRKLLPDRQNYGSQAYGHKLGVLSPKHDESIKAIDASNFYPQWAQRINTHFRLMVNYPHRPKTWKEHAQQIFDLRKQILARLDQIQRALNTFFRKRKRTSSLRRLLSDSDWESFKHLAQSHPLLPQTVVDEWGFSGEGITRMNYNTPNDSSMSNNDSYFSSASGLDERSLALTKHKVYIDNLHRYLRDLSIFASQGMNVSGRSADEMHPEYSQERLSIFNLYAALESLTQMQIDFRERVGRFVPDADLSRLEDKEQGRYRELWCVWYQYIFHRRIRVQDAAREFVQEHDNALKKVKRQVRRKLREVQKEGFSASFARIDLQHEGESIPCILLEINEPTLYWQAVEDTVVALRKALHTNSDRSLRYFAVQLWMKKLAIVPIIRGRALSQSALVLPTSAIQSGSALEDWYWYIPKEVSNEDWAKLSISLWHREQFEPAIRFTEDLVALSLHTAQIGDLCRFSHENDDVDSEVIESFLQSRGQDLSRYLQRVYDLGGELLRQHAESQNDPGRPNLGYAVELLYHICQQIKPAKNDNASMKMTVDEIGEWSKNLEQMRTHAEQFKLLWIADVLDNSPTEG